ncbi:MAG TPA: dihydrodipicolinate reductase C-terminal domain-containing protein [Nocardia sp.]|uniref:dihydrodipicolinate reductase C-terminal domain-containing protein n=1 Tax=Nocardia TaxID=1817 RepID=UPI00245876B3|nr:MULTISPECIES: dihydrodipicolinate reductase C-terminal domain-containing protein [Nocardia]HLS75817.1 dihydrodipicolinate reductase C-terminal domain-containing protein [Nocardia sp.]
MSPTPERPVAVVGATGRLGRAVTEACARHGVRVATVADSTGWTVGDEPVGVVIDASRPAALDAVARHCTATGAALLTCVSGRPPESEAVLAALSERVPVLVAANLSPLHWLQARAAELLARLAPALVPDAEITVLDRHPTTKLDAPSATARKLAALLPEHTAVHSARYGAAVSDHHVLLTVGGESLELSHRVRDLRGPATAALALAAWLERARPGRYAADDVFAELAGAPA